MFEEMGMDQTTLNFIAGGGLAALGWFARMLWERQEAHGKEIADVRILLAGNYVTHTKLGSVISELKEDLRYIRDKLDEVPQRRASDTPR
jgi:hypothetical protein